MWVSTSQTRAGPGGTGFAKCAGNYAGSLSALAQARSPGCPQALFLDAAERRYIEEMAGMDMLCSDKTGTLTLNKVPLHFFPPSAPSPAPPSPSPLARVGG